MLDSHIHIVQFHEDLSPKSPEKIFVNHSIKTACQVVNIFDGGKDRKE